jgi:hypothetical protein
MVVLKDLEVLTHNQSFPVGGKRTLSLFRNLEERKMNLENKVSSQNNISETPKDFRIEKKKRGRHDGTYL